MISKLLKDKTVADFSILENNFCSLPLNDGYGLGIECLCRFIGDDGAFFSVDDHGQQFGLPAPFDAASEIKKRIKGKKIARVSLEEDTADLTLHFEGGRLELICNSSGYECYQLSGPDNFLLVERGGQSKPTEPIAAANRSPAAGSR